VKKIDADKETTNEKDTLLKNSHSSKISGAKDTLKSLGPGLITGASDDDPSGIATFSQAGAQFGFGMLWMALFQYPMMTIIQEMCARLGLVTGSGLGGIIKKRYSKKILVPLSGLVLIANTINIGADIAAMGASVRLLAPEVPVLVSTIIFCGAYYWPRNIHPLSKIYENSQVSCPFPIVLYYYCNNCWRQLEPNIDFQHNSTYRD
jgi:hypothetical protein